jgi:hypothetical protein
VDAFLGILDKLREDTDAPLALANVDLDTGNRVKRGDYPLCDEAYARLLERLSSKATRVLPRGLKENILDFYAGFAPGTDAEQKVNGQLEVIKAMRISDALN